MDIILDRKQMLDIDKRTIEEYKTPSRVLMECAGVRCTDAIISRYPDELKQGALVLCGSGNNGGDGYVVARHLYQITKNILILSFGKKNYSKETKANRSLCEKLDIPIIHIKKAADLCSGKMPDLRSFGVIIDAIYGIGFRGSLPDEIAELFKLLSPLPQRRVALDIPSGIDANTGNGSALMMDLTLAIAALKYGHLLGDGKRYCGEIITLPIGIPPSFFDEINSFFYRELILPERFAESHKGSYGRIEIFGGSPGFEGSVCLSALAALRSGGGLVSLHSPKASLAMKVGAPEIMAKKLTQDIDELDEIIQRADAICIGPGLGLDEEAKSLLKTVLTNSNCPTIVDADALTLISQDPKLYELIAKGNILLTPHKAEFCRIADITREDFDTDPIAHARAFSQKYSASILIKSHVNILIAKDELRIISAGNDALSTGGSGDALAGVIASFAAQKLSLLDAASSAALLMGKTAEHLSKTRQSFSILPSDIINSFGEIYD